MTVLVTLEFEGRLAHQGPTRWVLAYEPTRELQRLHPVPRRRVAIGHGRRFEKRRLLREVNGRIEAGQPLGEPFPQTRLRNHGTRTLGIVPEVESAGEHCVVEKVDQRAGSVRADHLTAADLAVGPMALPLLAPCRAATHGVRPPSGWRSNHRWTVGSTSRMDVGAAKRPSSLWRGGRSSSSTVKSSGRPPRLSRSYGE